jgi:phage-related protein
MALEIFKLVGSIFIDNEKANDSLKKTDKAASTMAEGLGKAGKVAAGVGVAIGTAVVGAGTAMVGMANDASKVADEIDKASIRMGISTDSYQELAYAAGQCGVEMSTMEQAAKKLEGTDMNFDDAIDQIMSLETAEERSAAAAELFGEKIAYTLSPLIEQSADDFNGLIDRSHELGIIMSEDAVKAGVAYGDLSSDLEQSFGMLKTNLGSALFPVLNQVIEKLIEFMPTIQEIGQQLGPIASDFIEKLIPPMADLATELFPVLLDSVGEIIPLLADLVSSIVPVLVDLLTTLTPILVQIIQQVLPVVGNLLALVLPLVSQLLEFITPILGAVLQLLSPLLTLISAILTPILELLNVLLTPLLEILNAILLPVIDAITILLEPMTALLTALLEPMVMVLEAIIPPCLSILNACIAPIFEALKTLFAWASPVFTTAFDWLKGFFKFVIENVGGDLSNAFKNFGTLVSNVWEGLKSSFKNGINFWINAINTLINGVNNLSVPDWVTKATGISSVNIPTIPALAEGGIIEQSGRVLVGEYGPEFLDLPRGAQVTPLNNNPEIDYEKLSAVLVDALVAAGFGRMVVPVQIGNAPLETVVVDALNNANYRSGGR